ncbi:MAG: hypothetical protein IIA41_09595 [SAR324 cluster bacterium]|nr:hypothetical protein [SAR324 cluster bacterium]
MASFVRSSALIAGILLVLAGCAADPRGDLDAVRDDQFRIRNPGEPGAAASAIGCGESKKDALANARRAAEYNLRSMMGTRRLRIRYETLGRIPDPRRVCVEVEAISRPR